MNILKSKWVYYKAQRLSKQVKITNGKKCPTFSEISTKQWEGWSYMFKGHVEYLNTLNALKLEQKLQLIDTIKLDSQHSAWINQKVEEKWLN